MDFRLQHSRNSNLSSGSGLLFPRKISFASEIPNIGLNGKNKTLKLIRLRGVLDDQAASFVSTYGAFRQGPFWVVDRKDPFPFDLGDHLPRMAQRSIVPEIVDFQHPSTSLGCLENMMHRPSWLKLTANIWRKERVCYECGSVPFKPERLEGHEVWETSRMSSTGILKRLVAIRLLCGLCVEMKFLGAALQRNRFDQAFERLCLVNRIPFSKHSHSESSLYRKEIEAHHDCDRDFSHITYDLSALHEETIILKDTISLSDDGSLHRSGNDKIYARITDADIGVVDGLIMVRPRGWAG